MYPASTVPQDQPIALLSSVKPRPTGIAFWWTQCLGYLNVTSLPIYCIPGSIIIIIIIIHGYYYLLNNNHTQIQNSLE